MTETPNYLGGYMTWQCNLGSGTAIHIISCNDDYEGFETWPESLQRRALCYSFIDHMPEAGLEEALTGLADYWEYYSRPRSQPSFMPQVSSVPNQCLGVQEGEPLYIGED